MSELNQNQEGLQAEQEYKNQVQATPVVTERKGWVKKGDNFWTFANYDNLIAEYKAMIPRINKWKSPTPLKDPLDGQMYIFGMTEFDTGGTSIWSRLATGGSGFGGGKKAWYKTIGVMEGDSGQINSLLAAGENEQGISYKYANTFQLKTLVQNQDGTKSIVDKIMHVLLIQKRIEYGS